MAEQDQTPLALEFEEGWKVLEEAFNNLTSMVEGSTSYKVTSDAYMMYYTTVYEACVANPVAASQFYTAYKTSFEDYVSSKILPSLQQSRKEDLVANVVKSWSNYKVVTYWFYRFMLYIDRYYLAKNHLPSLDLTSYLCFYDKIFGELNDQIKDAVLSMIRDQRLGNQIDEKLLNDVKAIYNDMATRSTEHAHYKEDLEKSMTSYEMSVVSIKTMVESSSTKVVNRDSFII